MLRTLHDGTPAQPGPLHCAVDQTRARRPKWLSTRILPQQQRHAIIRPLMERACQRILLRSWFRWAALKRRLTFRAMPACSADQLAILRGHVANSCSSANVVRFGLLMALLSLLWAAALSNASSAHLATVQELHGCAVGLTRSNCTSCIRGLKCQCPTAIWEVNVLCTASLRASDNL